MATVVYGDFEWDDVKAETNLTKHNVSFQEATTAVVDPEALLFADESDPGEERVRVIGRSSKARILLVVIVERGDRERIISARRATRAETALYPQGT